MIAVRAARTEDAATVARLATELGYPTAIGQARLRLERLAGESAARVLIAELDGVAVAWLHVAEVCTVESDPYAEIVGLVVADAQRGSGIGAALVAAAIDWASARRLDAIRVRSNVVRERAHRFYERQGFQASKSQRVFTRAVPVR